MVITFHSHPYTVGRTTADRFGDFSATVAVPTKAAYGNHHFVATGFDRAGKMATLATAVKVVGLGDGKGRATTTAVLVLISVAIPVVAWFALGIPERLRKRRGAG